MGSEIVIHIPLVGVWVTIAVGSGIGAFAFILLLFKFYESTDAARHSYMARQLQGLRHRHQDWEPVPESEFAPTGKLYRIVTWVLDKIYSGKGK